MKSLLTACLVLSTTSLALAQEQGRVLSTSPIFAQVAVPQQICQDETAAYRDQGGSGAGAVLGALAGGVVGNAIGNGGGRAAATAMGVIGGAMLGNQAESNGRAPQYQTVRRCSTQTFYQNQTVGYNVVYEFAGRNYTTRTDSPPGDWIALNVQPAANSPAYSSNGYYSNQQWPQAAYATTPPVYVQPGYYGAPSGYSASDYVAPMVIGAAIVTGTYYASRPHHGSYYRPGPGWRPSHPGHGQRPGRPGRPDRPHGHHR